MTGHKNNCVVCGAPLVYLEQDEILVCHDCGRTLNASVRCENGHYLCDACHSQTANEWILQQCLVSSTRDPLGLAVSLMKDARVKMHGPEHHFLVPAVLWTTYANTAGVDRDAKTRRLVQAKQRAETVVGGSCGFNGNCGAAVGTGIFISLVTGATPLSREAWRACNLMTARSLMTIANQGGPRCCKRDSYLAIREAISFLDTEMGVKLESHEPIVCEFSHLNRECLHEDCPFYS